jgi:lipopolysaccharide/colanic/teichoic acid biosynthesis glycosyltransferase
MAAFVRLGAIVLLALCAPVMLVIAGVIRIDSPGPVFYRQERVGYLRKRFQILKFRTMVAGADLQLAELLHLNEHDGALFKMKNDPRITRVGRLLRKFSLDELPQLINVVRGDMVFVGPRPILPRETVNFGQAEDRRFHVRPGMTGLWQVSGRADIPWADAVALDLYYLENWSPILDLKILARTLWVVLAGTGV